jgi:hypothetical protein
MVILYTAYKEHWTHLIDLAGFEHNNDKPFNGRMDQLIASPVFHQYNG